jgi:hypothetical protein
MILSDILPCGVRMEFFEVFKIVLYVVGALVLLGVLGSIIGVFFKGVWALIDHFSTVDWRSAKTKEQDRLKAEAEADARKRYDFWIEMQNKGTPLPVTWLPEPYQTEMRKLRE